ncbi:hypothetical protein QTP88_008403 [Uroleucon formosanum]
MFDFSVFNIFLSSIINRQQFARPVVAGISPIIDIALSVNKIQKDDLQPLKELSIRTARALKKIGKLETSRHRAAVAMRMENLDLMEDRRMLMQLRNYSTVSTGTQTFVEKKPCRVSDMGRRDDKRDLDVPKNDNIIFYKNLGNCKIYNETFKKSSYLTQYFRKITCWIWKTNSNNNDN